MHRRLERRLGTKRVKANAEHWVRSRLLPLPNGVAVPARHRRTIPHPGPGLGPVRIRTIPVPHHARRNHHHPVVAYGTIRHAQILGR